jgi:hypothetical protein
MKALKWIECRIYGVAILLLGLLLAPLVFAQEEITYTGVSMTGVIQLGQTLADNSTQAVTPTSFNFGSIADSNDLTPINQSNDPTAMFQFTTNSTGEITAWSIGVANNIALGNTYVGQSLISTPAGDTYSAYLTAPSCAYAPGECYHERVVSGAGVVVDPPSASLTSVVKAPEIDWSRAIAAVTLLCGFTLVLRDSRRV